MASSFKLQPPTTVVMSMRAFLLENCSASELRHDVYSLPAVALFWFWHRQAWAAVHLRECICIFATVIKLQLPFVATAAAAAVPAVGHESGACLKVGNAFFAASSWLPIAVSPSLCVRKRGLPVSLCGCEYECVGVCASACVYLYICTNMQQGRLAMLQF